MEEQEIDKMAMLETAGHVIPLGDTRSHCDSSITERKQRTSCTPGIIQAQPSIAPPTQVGKREKFHFALHVHGSK